MTIGSLIMVETSSAGNLGAAMRVAANFAVPRIALVRPLVSARDPEVLRWACGAESRLSVHSHETLSAAARDARTLVATASGRGRTRQPLVELNDAVPLIQERGLADAALVFGNESSGLQTDDLAACDLAIRIPTTPEFPVLNLTQTVAIVLATLSMTGATTSPPLAQPASVELVSAMMEHLKTALLAIGFLDPVNPDRILRKLRRVMGRAVLSEDEVAVFRGISRQILWAARTGPLRAAKGDRTPPTA